MTLKDILTKEMHDRYGDMDVYSDCIDDWAPAWCGNTFTEMGERFYAKVLELEAKIDIHPHGNDTPWYDITVCTESLPYPQDETRWAMAKVMFEDMCGYCDCDHYDKMFID